MDMCVGLDGHQLIDVHRTGLTHPAEIVALQVDQHDVLGALLRMRRQLAHFGEVIAGSAAARPGARNWSRIDPPATDAQQPFGRGAEDADTAPLCQCGKRRRIRGAQSRVQSGERRILSELVPATVATGWPDRYPRRARTPWHAPRARDNRPGLPPRCARLRDAGSRRPRCAWSAAHRGRPESVAGHAHPAPRHAARRAHSRAPGSTRSTHAAQMRATATPSAAARAAARFPGPSRSSGTRPSRRQRAARARRPGVERCARRATSSRAP